MQTMQVVICTRSTAFYFIWLENWNLGGLSAIGPLVFYFLIDTAADFASFDDGTGTRYVQNE